MQDTILAQDLAIQFDAAVEFAYLEYERGRIENDFFQPPFSPVKEGILDRLVKLSSSINQEVPLGFHLCYGDRENQHFVQPENTSLLVEIANGISERVGRQHSVSWINMPVPKDRTDNEYFEPSEDLAIGDAELYLGLIHAHDESGTAKRLEAAQSICPLPFGVATECGLGRTRVEDVDSIFEIARDITAPKDTD